MKKKTTNSVQHTFDSYIKSMMPSKQELADYSNFKEGGNSMAYGGFHKSPNAPAFQANPGVGIKQSFALNIKDSVARCPKKKKPRGKSGKRK